MKVQPLKRNRFSDSSIYIGNDVNIGGDSAIGSNAKIIKKTGGGGKHSLFKFLVDVVVLLASTIAIYSYIKGP